MAGSCLACRGTFADVAAHVVTCTAAITCYVCGCRVRRDRIGRHVAAHAGCYAVYCRPPHTPPPTPLATLSCPTCQRRFARQAFFRRHVLKCTVKMAPPLRPPPDIKVVDVDPDTLS